MRFTGATGAARGWWWIFGICIGAPAVVLAMLGLRAVQLERIERKQQIQEQQGQTALLIDAAIAAALAEREGELTRPQPRSRRPGTLWLQIDRRHILIAPEEKVYFAEPGERPEAVQKELPAPSSIADEAQAAEAQKNWSQAESLYRKLESNPKLRAWAQVGLARIRAERAGSFSAKLFKTIDLQQAGAYTPGGLPVALVACGYAEQAKSPERLQFLPLLRSTLEALRAGRWWLSYEARKFHDGELRRLTEAAGGGVTPEDPLLADLASAERAMKQRNALRQEGVTRGYSPEGQRPFLLLVNQRTGESTGLALFGPEISRLLNAALQPVLANLSYHAAVRDGAGRSLWKSGEAAFHGFSPLRAVSGWEVAFSEPSADPTRGRRLLWYALIALLLATMALGLVMTLRVVRREVELARLQSEFTAGVTHEFKSPITGIRLLLERITSGRVRSAEDVAEYYGAIEIETGRLERLVNRLLETHKIQAGRQRYHFAPASVVAIAQKAITHLRPQADAKRIFIEIQADESLPETVLDRTAIQDLLENLLDNAIKYSPPETRVHVKIERQQGDVAVEVRDEGIGIEAEDLPRIFERFYRVRRGDRQAVQGTGLGLALVKAAAEGHGGSIEVKSAPGQGSRFRLRIPIRSEDIDGSDTDRG